MNWGLIGASTIAAGHMISAIRSCADNQIISVLSTNAERGAEYAKTHDIRSSTTDLEAMLADPNLDAVYISTTNEKHKFQALAAIAAGKHVLCEKPLAMSCADALEMVHAAEEAGVVLATNHHLRNAGSHLKIKELIAAGRIGDVQAVRVFHAVYLPESLQGWRINNAVAGGGVIPDIVVHDADTVGFHLGEYPLEVTAIEASGSLGQGVEDSVMSVWKMPSGILVQTHEGFTLRHAETGLEFHGTKGSIIAKNVMTQLPIGQVELRTPDGVEEIKFSDHNLYARSIDRFMGAVAGQGQPAATGRDGVRSLAVAAAVKQAATTGARVAVNYGGL
ncbi:MULTISPECIES: Gfo/Idh/MocA family protein [Falsihalocynthiibacter]|uniref:Gfo/Idh/MocA family protein n=1 Tax=Falsihalocynthiibacter TaxID=2854182 RepID=UPI0030016CF0